MRGCHRWRKSANIALLAAVVLNNFQLGHPQVISLHRQGLIQAKEKVYKDVKPPLGPFIIGSPVRPVIDCVLTLEKGPQSYKFHQIFWIIPVEQRRLLNNLERRQETPSGGGVKHIIRATFNVDKVMDVKSIYCQAVFQTMELVAYLDEVEFVPPPPKPDIITKPKAWCCVFHFDSKHLSEMRFVMRLDRRAQKPSFAKTRDHLKSRVTLCYSYDSRFFHHSHLLECATYFPYDQFVTTAMVTGDGQLRHGCKDLNRWGPSCTEECPKNCKRNVYELVCDRDSGNCLIGCVSTPGLMISPQCDMPCPKYTYGADCRHRCSINCGGDGRCDRFDGKCTARACKKGFDYFKSPYCSTRCADGSYGENCNRNCSTNCGEKPCHYVTGACYEDESRSGPCQDGFYGEGCKNNCSENCLEGKPACDPVTGECTKGCKRGFEPPKCSETCSKKYFYGVSCNKVCYTCPEDSETREWVCEPTYGKCMVAGCWKGSALCFRDLKKPLGRETVVFSRSRSLHLNAWVLRGFLLFITLTVPKNILNFLQSDIDY